MFYISNKTTYRLAAVLHGYCLQLVLLVVAVSSCYNE